MRQGTPRATPRWTIVNRCDPNLTNPGLEHSGTQEHEEEKQKAREGFVDPSRASAGLFGLLRESQCGFKCIVSVCQGDNSPELPNQAIASGQLSPAPYLPRPPQYGRRLFIISGADLAAGSFRNSSLKSSMA